jgi:hypothetical protein
MPAKIVIELDSGDKVLFGGSVLGLRELNRGGEVVRASGAKFGAALGQLGQVVHILNDSIDRLPKRPEKIEVELRASLSSDCNLWIVSGDGEAEFKVTLSWGKE